MRTHHHHPIILAGLVLLAGFATPVVAAPKTQENITVIFQDQDKFTDVLENGSNTTSDAYLDQLRDFLGQTAAPFLTAGQKLVITVTDIDLAGETRFNQPHQIRVMKDVYPPRVQLKFRLLKADGKIVKEGERHLVDSNYQSQLGMVGSRDPLYYDKQLLRRWIEEEFRPKS